MSKSIVYHGNYIVAERPELVMCIYTKDFGTGFYCTSSREQAELWAGRFEKGILNAYELSIDTRLSILEFTDMTEEWLDFIVDCRLGKKHNYDIVIGPVANDPVYTYVTDYLECSLTREQFWVLAKFTDPTYQISFCSKDSLKCLKFAWSQEV